MKKIWLTLKELFPYLPHRDRVFSVLYSFITVLVSLLDAASLGLLAVVMSSATAEEPIDFPIVGVLTADSSVILVVLACALILLKSIVAIFLHRIAATRFSKMELYLGQRLFEVFLRTPWEHRLNKSAVEMVRLADSGMSGVVSGFLLPLSTLLMQVSTIVSVLVVLVLAQPVVALVSMVFFGLVAVILQVVVNKRVLSHATTAHTTVMKTSRLMNEMARSLKELTIRNKLQEVISIVDLNRSVSTRAKGDIAFLGGVPKYAMEISLVIGVLLLGAIGMVQGGVEAAIGAIAFFTVAAFRITPALISLQGVVATAAANVPITRRVIDDINQANVLKNHEEEYSGEGTSAEKIEMIKSRKKLELRNISYSYPGSSVQSIKNVSLTIELGTSTAFVGTSGAGKTTLVDILLGLLEPTSGEIRLEELNLQNYVNEWRHLVGYVPQEVVLFEGTIAQNVALTWGTDYDAAKVVESLKKAQMYEFVLDRWGTIDGEIGESGMSLSGGQKQRIGIARALYNSPLILILDEATSSLDTKTEADIIQELNALKGEVTLISIAHRLATIRKNDQICFLKEGELIASGKFSDVVSRVPEFAQQADLAGLQ